MKILVLGGGGAQGTIMIPELAQMEQVEQITCADINLERIIPIAEKNSKILAKIIDASDSLSLKNAAEDADIIVNLLSPSFNLKVMKIATETGCHYQDLAGIIDIVAMASRFGTEWRYIAECGMKPTGIGVEECIDLGLQFEKNNTVAMIHTGSAPGLVNVLSRDCADRMDSVSSIRIRNYSNIQTRRFVLFWWSPEVAWNDMAAKPLLYENGKYSTVPPFSGWEDYQFNHLKGTRSLSHHLHEEVATLPKLIGKGVRYVDFKYGGPHAEIASMAYKLGWLGKEPIQVKNQTVIPRDVLLALTPDPPTAEEIAQMVEEGVDTEEKALTVDVKGIRNGKALRCIATVKAPGFAKAAALLSHANPVSYVTGLSAAAFTKLIINGSINQIGMVAPEELGSRARPIFYNDIASNGIRTEFEEL